MKFAIGRLALLCAFLLACEGEAPPPDARHLDAVGPDGADAPAVDAPTMDAPAVDAPTMDAPAVDAPMTDVADASCTSDRACSAAGLVCDTLRGRCVECRSASDCGDGGRLCFGGRCASRVACTSSRTCPDQVCDPARGYCVDCVTDVDCPSGERCLDGACHPRPPSCRSSRECSGLGLVCDTTAGICVECVSAADCPMGSSCGPGGACRPALCRAGATECVDAARVRTCSADGTAWVEAACASAEVCAMGRCQPRVCMPGAADCADATTRSVCNPDGLGRTATPCRAGERCAMGACLPTTCAPGTSTCADATTRAVCNADGLGATPTPCAAREACIVDRCVAWTCTPGAASCPSATSRGVCSADGQTVVPTACPSGQRCSGGACVPSTGCTPGAADCADASTRRVCNADGMTYTSTACSAVPNAAGRCEAGACTAACNVGFGDCDGVASNGCEVILAGSIAHCGRCGNACPSPANAFASCGSSTCGFVCAVGFGDCDRAPANGCEAALNTAMHCGACGNACAAGQVCEGGRCVAGAVCVPVALACGTRCVDPRGDRLNCGACGNVCPTGQVCAFGRCLPQTNCPVGTRSARTTGSCTLDPTDAFNCGTSMDTACGPSSVCTQRMIGSGTTPFAICAAACDPGQTQCGRECANLTNNVYHCGACNNACTPGQICVGGRCTTDPTFCAPGVSCGGRCVDLRGDRLNCGACGNVCPTGQVCAFSRCLPQTNCPVGTRSARTTGSCALDPTDAFNCGTSMDTVCGPSSVCTQRMIGSGTTPFPICAAACDPGQSQCGRECANTSNNVYHCGACNNACAPGQFCFGGRCTTDPTFCAPGVSCGGRCVDLRGDRLNCGACGNVCPTGQVCAFSRCLPQTNCPVGTRSARTTGSCALDPVDAFNCGTSMDTVCGPSSVCTQRMIGSGTTPFAICAAACDAGQTPCGRECANLTNNVYHCGACNNACAPGQFCFGGRCRP